MWSGGKFPLQLGIFIVGSPNIVPLMNISWLPAAPVVVPTFGIFVGRISFSESWPMGAR